MATQLSSPAESSIADIAERETIRSSPTPNANPHPTPSLGRVAQDWQTLHTDLTRQVRGTINRHPLAAVGIALGVGFLLSRFIR